MKIPCSVVRDLLPLYAEEMIEEETRTLVDEHLEDCADCSRKLEEIKAAAAVPAENTAVDTAKPLLALKKMINKRRWITAAIAALCVFILLVSAFHRINEWHQVPWEEGLIQVTGIEKMADVEKRNNPFPEEEEAVQLPDESRVLTIQFDSKITGIYTSTETNEEGTTAIIQGWSINPGRKLTGDYGEYNICPVPDRLLYDTGSGQVLLWGEPMDGGIAIMPRLALASYAILACCLASLSALLWFLFRNKKDASIIFRQIFFAPVSYLAAHVLTKGFHARTFFLDDDLAFIIVIGAAIYALLTLGCIAWQQRKQDKGTEQQPN